MDISFFKSIFNIKKFECAGVDGVIYKIQLQAAREGNYCCDLSYIGKLNNEFLGIPIVVKDTNNIAKNNFADDNGLVNEVKKLGLLVDRYVDLELRLGDTLIVYISRASA